jgi:hypothetical protein
MRWTLALLLLSFAAAPRPASASKPPAHKPAPSKSAKAPSKDAKASKSKKKKRRHGGYDEKRGWETDHDARVAGAPSLALESIDFAEARVVALVGGVTRPPPFRMFAFHDARDRHFIALGARCDAVDGTHQRCTLDLPRSYLRSRIVGMTVHIHQQEVQANPAEVALRFATASMLAGRVAVALPATIGARKGEAAMELPGAPDDDPGFMPPDEQLKLAASSVAPEPEHEGEQNPGARPDDSDVAPPEDAPGESPSDEE